jgi:hypothetical protein
MEYLRLRCRAAAGLQSMIVLHLFHRSGTLQQGYIRSRPRFISAFRAKIDVRVSNIEYESILAPPFW